MKIFSVTLFILLAIAVRTSPAQEQTKKPNETETETPGSPGLAQVSDNDKQMDRAVENAQRNLGFFLAALHAKKSGDTVFEIKKGFVDGNNVEHLWIRGVTYDGNNFHGIVDNQPSEVKNVHNGQRITVAPGDVNDWMFLKDGKLIGAYTTRVLYARLSPEEKAEFDKRAEFKIE